MEFKKRLESLEKKYAVPDGSKLLYRKMWPLVMGNPETKSLSRKLADQEVEAFEKDPELRDLFLSLCERMEAGDSEAEKRFREAGIDPDLVRAANFKLGELREMAENAEQATRLH